MAGVDEPQNQVLCPQCGTPIPQGGTFCPECGLNMAEVAGARPAPRFCGHCGKPLVPGAAFCAECGQPLSPATATPAATSAPAVVQPATSMAPTPSMPAGPAAQPAPFQAAQALQPSPSPVAPPPAARRRAAKPGKALVAAVSALAAAAVIGGLLLFGPLGTKPSKRIPVMVTLQVPGLNERSSRIPVFVEGTTLDGKKFQENAFIDQGGGGLELPEGDYTLAVEASPIAEDGTIYQVPEEPIEVVVRDASADVPEAGESSTADSDAGDAAADSKPQSDADADEATGSAKPQSDANAGGAPADSGKQGDAAQDEEEPALAAQGDDPEESDSTESDTNANESQGASDQAELVVTIVLVLEPIEPTEVTEDQIAAAMAYVQKDDMRAAFAVRLKTAADDKVETAKKEEEAKKKAEEEAKRKAEEEAKRKAEEERRQREEEEAARRYAATHYDCEYFSVEVPESWEGNWTVDYESSEDENGYLVEEWTFIQRATRMGGDITIWVMPKDDMEGTLRAKECASYGTVYYGGEDGTIPFNIYLHESLEFLYGGATFTPYTV